MVFDIDGSDLHAKFGAKRQECPEKLSSAFSLTNVQKLVLHFGVDIYAAVKLLQDAICSG